MKENGLVHRLFGPLAVLRAHALEFAVGVGLISGAAVVAIYGKFLTAAILLFFAVLCFLRITRGRVNS